MRFQFPNFGKGRKLLNYSKTCFILLKLCFHLQIEVLQHTQFPHIQGGNFKNSAKSNTASLRLPSFENLAYKVVPWGVLGLWIVGEFPPFSKR